MAYRHSSRNVQNFTWMYVCLPLRDPLGGKIILGTEGTHGDGAHPRT